MPITNNQLLKTVCSLPTAPFVEGPVIQFIHDFVAVRKHLQLRRDPAGNLLIELKNPSRRPRWVFTAHMDHPGLVAEKMLGNRTLQAAFRGSVKSDFVKNAQVRFFDGKTETTGKINKVTAEEDGRPYPRMVEVKVSAPVPPGSIGMFDQGEGRFEKNLFLSRACDDLAGLAACLAMVENLGKSATKSPIAVLLTRAEEEAFIGCIAACEDGSLMRKSDRVIAIECSSVQPHAPQGHGVILRVGDRTSIFNSALTYFMGKQAEVLAKSDKSFKCQRALMPGGTCEATVYDVWGYTAASLCVPLGNYHNMDVKRHRIGPEYIDLSDWQNMVKLFVHLAKHGHEFDGTHGNLRAKVSKRYNQLRHLLK
jgi:endoglucanase